MAQRHRVIVDTLNNLPIALMRQLDALLETRCASWLVVAALVLLLASALPYFPDADPDLFARLAVGEIIHQTGTVPFVDTFAFTPTKSTWIDHEWFMSDLFFLMARWGGDHALFLLKLFFFASTIAFLLLTQQLAQVRLQTGIVWLLLLTPELMNGFLPNVRCQMATFLGVTFWLWAFCSARLSQRAFPLLLLPLAMVSWGNSHGGCVVGIAFSTIFALVCLFERNPLRGVACLSALGCIAALFVNPYGSAYLTFLSEAALHPRPDISEWGPLPVLSLRWWLLLGWSVVVGFALWKAPRILPKEVWLFIALGLWQAFCSDRLTPLAAILLAGAGAPLALVIAEACIPFLRARLVVLRAAIITAWLFFLAVGSVTVGREFWAAENPFQFSIKKYPANAVRWLRANREHGKLLIHFNEASFALWMLRHRFQVAIDGRYEEVYPEETFHNALAAIEPDHPRQRDALNIINPDVVLVKRLPRISTMDFPGFVSTYRDEEWEIFERDVPELHNRARVSVDEDEPAPSIWMVKPLP